MYVYIIIIFLPRYSIPALSRMNSSLKSYHSLKVSLHHLVKLSEAYLAFF